MYLTPLGFRACHHYPHMGLRHVFLPEMGQPILGFEAKELLYLSAFCVGLPGAFKATREWKADRWIGELSYPVYLVHVLVVTACGSHFGLSGELPVLGSIQLGRSCHRDIRPDPFSPQI